MEPSVFLLDEPLDNLDADMRITMRGELKRLQKDLGKTMIYVTHDQEEAMSLADRIVVMNRGNLQQFDSPQNIYNNPSNRFVAGFIGRLPMNFIEGYLQEDSGNLMFIDRSQSIRFDISKQRRVLEKSTSMKDIVLGIRPEHISHANAAGKNTFEVVVENFEFHGMENVVQFHLKGETEIHHRVMTPPHIMPEAGDEISVYFQSEKIHFIDASTELVLT
jgi:multiple sugar transport system ATP-binding protein